MHATKHCSVGVRPGTVDGDFR